MGEVPSLLRDAGHSVVVPDLTLRAGVTPSDHAAELVAAAGSADVVAGHSYGGLVAPEAAGALGARALVVVDGFVPDDGESAFDVQPASRERRRAQAAERGDGMWAPGADDPRLRPMPLSAFEAGCRVPAHDIQRTFVHCLQSDFDDQAARARARGWRVIEVDGEHWLPLLDPASTVNVLLEVADSVRGAG